VGHGRAGQHSSTSAFACATQCSGQFTERVLLSNVDYEEQIIEAVRKYVVSELFITEFRRQSELTVNFSLFHILDFPNRLMPF
jgi:hypothetical protein